MLLHVTQALMLLLTTAVTFIDERIQPLPKGSGIDAVHLLHLQKPVALLLQPLDGFQDFNFPSSRGRGSCRHTSFHIRTRALVTVVTVIILNAVKNYLLYFYLRAFLLLKYLFPLHERPFLLQKPQFSLQKCCGMTGGCPLSHCGKSLTRQSATLIK